MDARKAELRKIVVDIIFGKENVFYPPTQFAHLALGVAEVLDRRAGNTNVDISQQRLNSNDGDLVREIFWDLFTERVITIGMNPDNPSFPWFRQHSNAAANLKRATS